MLILHAIYVSDSCNVIMSGVNDCIKKHPRCHINPWLFLLIFSPPGTMETFALATGKVRFI